MQERERRQQKLIKETAKENILDETCYMIGKEERGL